MFAHGVSSGWVLGFMLCATPLFADTVETAPGTSPQAQQDQEMYSRIKEIRPRFGLNEDVLTPEDREELARAARFLKQQEGIRAVISGHADERGTEEFNLALGQRRAVAVRNYLQDMGVSPDRIQVVTYGENRPLIAEHNEVAWAANRRAEIHPEGTLAVVPASAQVTQQTPVAQPPPEKAAPTRQQERQQPTSNHDGARGRMLSWLPLWAGPVVMALAIPAALLAIPFLASMLYLGPSVWRAPVQGQEPLLLSGGGVVGNGTASPANLAGSLWSAALHPDQRGLSVPIAMVGAAGVLGAGVLALAALAVGGGLLGAALIPVEQGEPEGR
ncbi:MAG: OmpA family protein [Myxococcota bacterium]